MSHQSRGKHRPGTTLQRLRVVALTACWAISLALMALGTAAVDGVDHALQRTFFSWGIWSVAVAHILSGWHLVSHYARRERVRIEDLAKIMAEVARVQAEDHDGPSGGRPFLTLHRS